MTIYVAGTCDTKGEELAYGRDLIKAADVSAIIVDFSTSDVRGGGDVSAEDVARHHLDGASAVFTGDRGSAVAAMARAFTAFLASQDHVAGVVGLGGSGGGSAPSPAPVYLMLVPAARLTW